MKFNIGDRVCITASLGGDSRRDLGKGDTGTVVYISGNRAGVEWDKELLDGVVGHNCNGRCKSGHGWYINSKCIELCEDAISIDVSFLF